MQGCCTIMKIGAIACASRADARDDARKHFGVEPVGAETKVRHDRLEQLATLMSSLILAVLLNYRHCTCARLCHIPVSILLYCVGCAGVCISV